MKKNILLLGHTGFLGSHLHSLLADEFKITVIDKSIFDLSKGLGGSLKDYVRASMSEYAVICAAISDVEKCYQDQKLSQQVNVNGMQELLIILKENKIKPVFFSSDYVFSDKLTPYLETDTTSPETIYGSQKLAIEKFMQMNFEDFLIFRTSKLMSKTNHPKNILYPLIKNLREGRISRCFKDQLLNPVFVEDIALVVKKSIHRKITGIYHLGTKTLFNRYELGLYLANSLKHDSNLIEPVLMSDVKFSEKRPANNMLNCSKIESQINFEFCEIEDALSQLKDIR